MQTETALLVGILFAGATYLILQRSFVRILFGFVVLSNAANLLVLSMAGRPDDRAAPIVPRSCSPQTMWKRSAMRENLCANWSIGGVAAPGWKTVRMKKRMVSGSPKWEDSVMKAPWSARNPATAATMPVRSGHEMVKMKRRWLSLTAEVPLLLAPVAGGLVHGCFP